MSKKVKIELNEKGVGELLKGEKMQAVLNKHAERIRSRAESMSGASYGLRSTMTDRAGVNIYPDSPEAVRDNYENNTLLKALGAR